mmetsp:Transcript_3146/g.5950  ORF Transcript_3146/g.5950 Transcript_3146/m.5950 type:complete len:305 (+) Transcript_3146:97-1011(+)
MIGQREDDRDTIGDIELEPMSGSSQRMLKERRESGNTELGLNVSYHRTYCGGWLVTGPVDDSCDLQKMMFLVFPFAMCVWAGVAVPLLGGFFPLLVYLPLAFIGATFMAFVLCACTEPGVINPEPDTSERVPSNVRYCRKCCIYQDDNTRHCSYCNACIRELDHHCGVTGNCVGARNKVHFLMIFHFYIAAIWSIAVGVAFLIACQVQSRKPGFDGNFGTGLNIAAIVCTILQFVALAVSLLFYFMLYCGLASRSLSRLASCCCCSPLGKTHQKVVTDEREPACPGGLLGGMLTIPAREFYPKV